MPALGSSPLARGTLGGESFLCRHHGLIPARAGNTPEGRSVREVSGAHPRSRGEHPVRWVLLSRLMGSSPLARGTLAAIVSVFFAIGLIPARAGNIQTHPETGGFFRAHPRSRGEHRQAMIDQVTLTGSSPLARGTLRAVPASARL